MSAIGTPERPLRAAIVGSGPAGFYAAEHLLKRDDIAVEVDMFDRLPTPFGLVRAGVAPDHPKIKSVIRMYEKTAGREGFRFFGNVEVGRDVTVGELAERYHASSGFPARTFPDPIPPPGSSPGTTPTPTSPITNSTSPASARS
jgi:NADPH-dependent glutamate synthase beta subunit-like oxidoreductase